jgi:SAM-dependent methyltransferase
LQRALAIAPPPGKLLDVGCGTGEFLGLARDSGWDVSGTELSPHGAMVAAKADFPVFTGEVWEAGYPSEHFDLVTCWHVLEHVTDPPRFAAEFHRILRPGGYCLLATPNLDDRIFRAAYVLARGRRPRLYEENEREVHLFFFSTATLERLFASAGFTQITIGFDRGATAVRSKQLVDRVAWAWYRLTGRNWGMALELAARRPVTDRPVGSSPVEVVIDPRLEKLRPHR